VLKKAHILYILVCHLQIDANPYPAYHFAADPDPDPTFQFDADPCGRGSYRISSYTYNGKSEFLFLFLLIALPVHFSHRVFNLSRQCDMS
jgi:hypothetical protein